MLLYTQIKNSSARACPTIENDGIYIDVDVWHLLLRNVMRQIPTLLFGETGTAKTTIALFAAKTLNKPLHTVDMGGVGDAEDTFIGRTELVTKNGIVNTRFVQSPLCDFVQTNGIVLFEEINRTTPATNNFLFPMLDFRRSLNGKVFNENLATLATANIGSSFTGTSTLDRALEDRFHAIEINIPPLSDEIKLVKRLANVDEKIADSIVRYARDIRVQFNNGNISKTISTRRCIQIAELIADGWELRKAIELCVLPHFENEDGEASERSKVRALIMSI